MTEEYDLSSAQIDQLVTHRVGNKQREEGVEVSTAPSHVREDSMDLLRDYFLGLFRPGEIYAFTDPMNLEDNEVYAQVGKIFDDTSSFVEDSALFAELLYDASLHPKIKNGKLNVVLFRDLQMADELVDAIGLFKSENDVPFIQMHGRSAGFELGHQTGFEIKGVDKGCLIINANRDQGYDVLVIDRHNKMQDAQYWVHNFLMVAPVSNEFNNTNQVLDFTRDFVVNELKGDIEKTDEIDLLSKTMEYFSAQDKFEKAGFENAVLQDSRLIDAFNEYGSIREGGLAEESFDISRKAVSKQSKNFKSVLKLDKNFHVYIHGGQNMIEKGVDEQGRKYYKIFYEEEK